VFRALLDTCVLVPGLQRDFLLQLAVEEAYIPVWGSGILFELDYVLERIHQGREFSGSRQFRANLFSQMNEAFPGALVVAPKERNFSYTLLDPDDAHVVHAALVGKVDAIVTDDARAGFEESRILEEAHIEIVKPNDFAANTVFAHPDAGARAIKEMAARFSKPAMSELEIIEKLSTQYRMTDVAEILSTLL
jgi:predicted nucleic acid-binding protein